MSSMRTKPQSRRGAAFWLTEQDGALLRSVAKAEDRPLTMTLRRALEAYAAQSREYQEGRRQLRRAAKEEAQHEQA
jgi:hypothetical protein